MTETVPLEQVNVVREVERKPLENLDTITLEAVDESLASFGEIVKQVVYCQLQNIYHAERQDIPFRIEAFASAIEELFGTGATLIEMKIMERLHARAKGFLYIPRDEHLAFDDYVRNISHFLANSVTS